MEVLVQMCTRYMIHDTRRRGRVSSSRYSGYSGKTGVINSSTKALDTVILSFRPVVIFIFCKLLNLLSCGQAQTVKQARKI